MLRIIIFIIVFVLNTAILGASLLTEDALKYREQGFEAQRKGDLDKAQELYQKAIQLEPDNSVILNDLGVLYETKEQLNRAEEAYLKAIKVNPDFLAPYYNLACLYERIGNIDKAVEYLEKRVALGEPLELWTEKAKDKLASIKSSGESPDLISTIEPKEETPVSSQKEPVIKKIEAKDLTKEAKRLEAELAKKPKELEGQREILDPYLERAKKAYQNKDYLTALLEASKSLELNPKNKEAEELLRKSQKRLLVR